MAELIDLKASKVQERQRQVGSYGTQTPLSSTAVERGSTRWLNGSNVQIEGLLSVSGTLSGGGTFDWTGTLAQAGTSTFTGTVRLSGQTDVWGPLTVTGDTDLDGATTISGPTSVTGEFTVTGPTDLNGPTTVAGDTTVTGQFDVDGPMKTTGTLSVEGITTLKNDLNVTTGKIVAGEVTIDPGYLDGSVRFANGSYLAATPNGAQLIRGSGAVTVSGSQADMGVGGNSIIVNTTGTFLNGLPTTTESANLYISESGRVYRSTA